MWVVAQCMCSAEVLGEGAMYLLATLSPFPAYILHDAYRCVTGPIAEYSPVHISTPIDNLNTALQGIMIRSSLY